MSCSDRSVMRLATGVAEPLPIRTGSRHLPDIDRDVASLRHARTAQGASPRARRPEDQRAFRPHRQDDRRRDIGGILERRRRGALCGRIAAGNDRSRGRHHRGKPDYRSCLPWSFIRSSQSRRRASLAACTVPRSVSRTGFMPANLRMLRSTPRTPCARKYHR